ncbi:hypothetical protein D3C87_1349420 [compost metagenome]
MLHVLKPQVMVQTSLSHQTRLPTVVKKTVVLSLRYTNLNSILKKALVNYQGLFYGLNFPLYQWILSVTSTFLGAKINEAITDSNSTPPTIDSDIGDEM